MTTFACHGGRQYGRGVHLMTARLLRLLLRLPRSNGVARATDHDTSNRALCISRRSMHNSRDLYRRPLQYLYIEQNLLLFNICFRNEGGAEKGAGGGASRGLDLSNFLKKKTHNQSHFYVILRGALMEWLSIFLQIYNKGRYMCVAFKPIMYFLCANRLVTLMCRSILTIIALQNSFKSNYILQRAKHNNVTFIFLIKYIYVDSFNQNYHCIL